MRRPKDGRHRWLVVHQNSELYGADRVLLESASVLSSTGEVVVVLPADGPLVTALRDRGIRSAIFPGLFILRKADLRPKSLPGSLLRFARSVRYLRTLIVAEHITSIFVNTITLPVPILVGRVLGIPVVVHVHEAETQSPAVIQRVLTAPLLAADKIIVISEAVADFVGHSWPTLRRPTSIVRNPIRQPASDFVALQVDRPEILSVVVPGRWSERKGTDLAIAACALARERGVRLSLIVVGSVYPGYEWYEQEIRELAANVLPDTRFVTFADDLDALWRTADVTLVPSRMEPYGMVAAESLARGRVTIASNVDGLAEIVVPGRNGLLAQPAAESLAACLEQVWLEWPAARSMAQQGRNEARDWTTAAYGANLMQVLGLTQAS